MKRLTSKNWRAKLLSVLRARLTLENWRAKLMSVLLATTVWYLIKKTTPSPSETSSPRQLRKRAEGDLIPPIAAARIFYGAQFSSS
jgi:hypothetical protein